MKKSIFVVLAVQFFSISALVVTLAIIINPAPSNDLKLLSEKAITSVQK